MWMMGCSGGSTSSISNNTTSGSSQGSRNHRRPLIPRPPIPTTPSSSSSSSCFSHQAVRWWPVERQQPNTSSRWNPRKEQVQLLVDLYESGIRNPTALQIHQITAQLRRYGRVEGKNVFYWFQNHKARERQRRRRQKAVAGLETISTSSTTPMQRRGDINNREKSMEAEVPIGGQGGRDGDNGGSCSGERVLKEEPITLELFPLTSERDHSMQPTAVSQSSSTSLPISTSFISFL